jgi:hypothetical protein
VSPARRQYRDLFASFLAIRARYGRYHAGFHSTGSYLNDLAAEANELRRLFGGNREYWSCPAYRLCAKAEAAVLKVARSGPPFDLDRASRTLGDAAFDLDRAARTLGDVG